ncbi:branched-chain amino acid aminotransferase II [Abortiporus biennis]|nr:branched-chain amino acid aminotransferase II [Abortiporus biennis]
MTIIARSSSLLRSTVFRSTRSSWLSQARYNSSVTRDPMTGEFTSMPDIEPSKLQFVKTDKPKQPPASSSLVFGHTFTDHMLTIPWSSSNGWGVPKIQPYAPLNLEPSATVFHYAQALFEGLKAYRDSKGRVTLFRPDMNMKRMNTSAARIALPTFNGDAVIELLKQLIKVDKHWIPDQPGYSLYLRPTLIGTQAALGIAPPTEALLFVICSPVGPYYPQGFKPVALYGTTEYTRACPGGIGAFKLGANYAPGVVAQKEAAKKGYVQNLWLWGPDHHITEVGTMNAFAVLKDANGVTELVTPPLDGVILPGVTRDSVLTLAREHAEGKTLLEGLPEPGKFKVSERPITMKEVKDASKQGRLVEFFGTGTAAVISPVDRIGYLGEDIHIPTGPDGMGPVSRPVWKQLSGIQSGAIPHPWSVVVTEE